MLFFLWKLLSNFESFFFEGGDIGVCIFSLEVRYFSEWRPLRFKHCFNFAKNRAPAKSACRICLRSYKHFPPTPWFVHQVKAKPPVHNYIFPVHNSIFSLEQGLIPACEITSCYTFELYLRTLSAQPKSTLRQEKER